MLLQAVGSDRDESVTRGCFQPDDGFVNAVGRFLLAGEFAFN
jgi:hypothetical protein